MTEEMTPTPTKKSTNRTLIIIGIVILACVLLCVCVACVFTILGPQYSTIFSSISRDLQ